MSLVFTRQLHSKRLPNYNGWWTQILKQATNPIEQSMQGATSTRQKVPLPIPFAEVIEPTQPIITNVNKPKVLVHLKGTPIELPEKPEPPENCCMSGCAHCVWDMYQEDMEDYAARKKEIKSQFLAAGEPLPRELDPSSTADDAAEEMDPTMKAFLEMERKLNKK